MVPIQLNISNNTLNISINIADLLDKGSININLNNQNVSNMLAIPVANVVSVEKQKKTKKRPVKLVIEDSEDEEPLLLCKEVEPVTEEEILSEEEREEKIKKIRHIYERDDEGMIKCPYCDCKKKNLSTISMHVKVNHATEMGVELNPHICNYEGCNKSFPIKTRLQHHINNHHKIENMNCPFPGCNYTDAKNKQTLYTHYVRKHMNYETMCKGNVCNTCKSVKPTGIIYHLATCHPSSPYSKKL